MSATPTTVSGTPAVPVAAGAALVRYASLADSPEGRFRLVIDTDGSGTFVSGVSGAKASIQLSQAQLTRLRDQLTASHFARLNPTYGPSPSSPPVVGGAPDRVTYGAKTVSVAIGATTPAALGTLIAGLDDDVDAFSARAQTGRPLVSYAGGVAIADGNDALTMRTDGSGSFTHGTTTSEVRLTRAQVAHVQTLLTRAHFTTLHSVYRSQLHLMGPTPDVVTYDGRRVTVQPAARRPARLNRVIEALRTIVDGFQMPLRTA